MQQPGQQRRGCGFAVRAGNAQRLARMRKQSQNFRTLMRFHAAVGKEVKLTVVARNGRRINHQRILRITVDFGNFIFIVGIVDGNSLFPCHLFRQRRLRAVIAGHIVAFELKITGQSTHADTADTDKIHVFNVVQNRHCFTFSLPV